LEVLKHLTELKKLHLDNNGLTNLPEKFLWRNTKLKSLSLSGNKLENLPCELWAVGFVICKMLLKITFFTKF